MCPDTKNISVQGGVVKEEYKFELLIARIGTGGEQESYGNVEQELDTAFVISTLTRYFDPENYVKNGYQDLISVDNDIIYPVKEQMIVMRKQIAQH